MQEMQTIVRVIPDTEMNLTTEVKKLLEADSIFGPLLSKPNAGAAFFYSSIGTTRPIIQTFGHHEGWDVFLRQCQDKYLAFLQEPRNRQSIIRKENDERVPHVLARLPHETLITVFGWPHDEASVLVHAMARRLLTCTLPKATADLLVGVGLRTKIRERIPNLL